MALANLDRGVAAGLFRDRLVQRTEEGASATVALVNINCDVHPEEPRCRCRARIRPAARNPSNGAALDDGMGTAWYLPSAAAHDERVGAS